MINDIYQNIFVKKVHQSAIYIPKEIRKLLDVNNGDKLAWKVMGTSEKPQIMLIHAPAPNFIQIAEDKEKNA